MKFYPSKYLEYVKDLDLEGIECNLAFSGIHLPFSMAELGVTSRVLEAAGMHDYGNEDLKRILANQYDVKPKQVLIPGGGSSLCNYLLISVLAGPVSKILLEWPVYEPLRAVAASTGAKIEKLQRRVEDDYAIDLDQFDHLMDETVDVVIVTRLHNPSGKDIAESDLLQMAEKAEKYDAYILVDEVYLDFMPEIERKSAAMLHERLISINSLTKVCGLGELRCGWAIGPEPVIWDCWRFNNLLGAVPPIHPEAIALELFRSGGIDRAAAWARRRARENLEIVAKWLKHHDRLTWVEPDAGIIAAVQIKDETDCQPFLKLLRNRFKTLVMPGSEFGINNGFRLGFGRESAEVQEGLRRIDLALQEYYG